MIITELRANPDKILEFCDAILVQEKCLEVDIAHIRNVIESLYDMRTPMDSYYDRFVQAFKEYGAFFDLIQEHTALLRYQVQLERFRCVMDPYPSKNN